MVKLFIFSLENAEYILKKLPHSDILIVYNGGVFYEILIFKISRREIQGGYIKL